MTKTDDGAETRESGVIEVAGVRFPKELTTTSPDGKSSKVVFDEIRVNEEFTDALFQTPRPQFVFEQKRRRPLRPPCRQPRNGITTQGSAVTMTMVRRAVP